MRIAYWAQQYGNDHTAALAKELKTSTAAGKAFMDPSVRKVNITFTDFCIFYTEKQNQGWWRSMVN